jgi:hypothetical protein
MEEWDIAQKMLDILKMKLLDNEAAQLELIKVQIELLKRIEKVCVIIKRLEDDEANKL